MSSSLEPTTPSSSTTTSHSRRHVGPTTTNPFTVDLVAAACRLLYFVASPPHNLRRSIRRYEELWLPLIAGDGDAGGSGDRTMLLPPMDVHFVWLCHCFHHASYVAYCASRFGKLIDRPSILNTENEEYAVDQCCDIWTVHYPSEPFDLDPSLPSNDNDNSPKLFEMVHKYIGIGAQFAAPFVSESVYLVAARRRYLNLLHLVKKMEAEGARLVPSLDILLMWLAHQSFPASYAKDIVTIGVGDVLTKLVDFGETAVKDDIEMTRTLWEEEYDEPYDKAGLDVDATSTKEAFYWEASPAAEDANRRYKGLQPRFLMEVYVFLKGEVDKDTGNKNCLRLRTQRCHRSLKLDKATCNLSLTNWQKAWHLYCEFGTRGVEIEFRQRRNGFFRSSKLLNNVVFSWNELLRETNLTVTKELSMQLRAMASITPPIQAPYLLKCVPDKVTDDNGAMVSDVVLRSRAYHTQEGRWLTRTVLNHGGKECFIVRIRVSRGIWRRGAETPAAVKWEERIIEVREGSWLYIANSIGYAPEKIVGTATPKKEDQQEKKVIWVLSTGDVLTIQWEEDLFFQLQTESSEEMQASLLGGRRLSYQVNKNNSSDNKNEDEDQYLTLVRTTPEYPEGKATALLNWKLLAVEFLPEEDAVFILLLCMAIARTMTEIRREDVAGLLVRRRTQEAPVGQKDWGSVLLPYSDDLNSHLQPWFRNAAEFLASAETRNSHDISARYSPADGKDAMYRQAIIP